MVHMNQPPCHAQSRMAINATMPPTSYRSSLHCGVWFHLTDSLTDWPGRGSHEPASIPCSTSGWQSAREHAADVLQVIALLWVWGSPDREPDGLAGIMVHMNQPPFPAQPPAGNQRVTMPADVLQDIASLWVWGSPDREPDGLAGGHGSHEPASIPCSTYGWQSARDHAADVLQDIASLWVWGSPDREPDGLAGVMVHMNLPPFSRLAISATMQPMPCRSSLHCGFGLT